MHTTRRLAVRFFGSAALFACAFAHADGPIDPGFYYGVPYTFPSYVGKVNVELTALAQDSRGHLISAGRTSDSSNESYLVTRLNLESPVNLDNGFGSNGIAANPFGTLIPSGAVAAAVDHHDRIVTGGYFALYRSCGSSPSVLTYYFSAVRLKNGGGSDDGSVDTSFGTGFPSGTTGVTVGDCNFTNRPTALTIGPNDEVTVGGSAYNGTHGDIALVRWDSLGRLDTSFGGSGIVNPSSAFDTDLGALTTDEHGRILAGAFEVGPTAKRVFIYRFEADGTLDPTFGKSGISQSDFRDYTLVFGIAVDPVGRVIVAGTTSDPSGSHAVLMRLTSSGDLDQSFGVAGISEIANFYVESLLLDLKGRPILGGSSEYGVATLAHFNLDGSLNTAVGFGGVYTTPLGLDVSGATSVVIDPMGRLNTAIRANDREGSVSSVVRYDELFGDGFD